MELSSELNEVSVEAPCSTGIFAESVAVKVISLLEPYSSELNEVSVLVEHALNLWPVSQTLLSCRWVVGNR